MADVDRDAPDGQPELEADFEAPEGSTEVDDLADGVGPPELPGVGVPVVVPEVGAFVIVAATGVGVAAGLLWYAGFDPPYTGKCIRCF